MNIVITGQKGLAKALAQSYSDCSVTNISRSSGYDINFVSSWADKFFLADMIINCAHSEYAQIKVLECFANAWYNDSSKRIINIGSKVTDYLRSETERQNEYFAYRNQKQSLQNAFANMVDNCLCDIRLYNLGPIDTDLIAHLNIAKMPVDKVAEQIKMLNSIPHLKRVDLW